MTIIDSSVWIAWLDKDDSQHEKAEKVLSVAQHIIIPEYVILEVCTVLSRNKKHTLAEQFLSIVLENNDIAILFSYEELFHATIAYFKIVGRYRLSFVDTMLAVLSKTYTITTFDTALQKVIQKRMEKKS